jgi:serine/threonine protein kinase
MRQLFAAIDYMHRVKKVIHCDLKPDNCLFLTDAPDAPLKVCAQLGSSG